MVRNRWSELGCGLALLGGVAAQAQAQRLRCRASCPRRRRPSLSDASRTPAQAAPPHGRSRRQPPPGNPDGADRSERQTHPVSRRTAAGANRRADPRTAARARRRSAT